MVQTLTYHAHTERQARINYILDTVGIGEPYIKHTGTDREGRAVQRTLTTTGVIIISNPETKQIITMYIAEVKQVQQLYYQITGRNHLPNGIYETAWKNRKLVKGQPRV